MTTFSSPCTYLSISTLMCAYWLQYSVMTLDHFKQTRYFKLFFRRGCTSWLLSTDEEGKTSRKIPFMYKYQVICICIMNKYKGDNIHKAISMFPWIGNLLKFSHLGYQCVSEEKWFVCKRSIFADSEESANSFIWWIQNLFERVGGK